MTNQRFVDMDDPVDEEDRKIQERRLKTYGEAALAVAASVDGVFVLFTEFKAGLEACDRVFELSKSLEIPQGIVITGPPGSSKTTLANYYVKSLPSTHLIESGFGAIAIRLRNVPSQGHIVSGLLRALKYPFTAVRRNRVFAMRDVAFEALKQRGTRIVFVDQAHCLSTQVRPKQVDVLETAASDTLREMMEEARVGVVLLADDSFRGLEYVDKALADRISVRLTLGYFENGTEWLGFLDAFQKNVTGIDLGILCKTTIPNQLHAATGGNRRSFKRLVVEAVLVCVSKAESVVTSAHLATAFAIVNGAAASRSNPFTA